MFPVIIVGSDFCTGRTDNSSFYFRSLHHAWAEATRPSCSVQVQAARFLFIFLIGADEHYSRSVRRTGFNYVYVQ